MVEDDIDVRGDVKAEELGVVAHVGDDGDGLLPVDYLEEALEEAGGADAAGERGDHLLPPLRANNPENHPSAGCARPIIRR